VSEVLITFTDDERGALSKLLANNLAEALTKTASEFLCKRRHRIPEREGVLAVLLLAVLLLAVLLLALRDGLPEASMKPWVAREEYLMASPGMYDDVEWYMP
jgi:hypothetical protein